MYSDFACVQTSPISFVVPFPRATKEIGDVCTQATVTLMTSFQIPTGTQCKNSFGKQFQFMDFSISPFSEGIRLVTPSKA